ncbi:Dyp-type peroxidase [Corynebacterium anserum]|nr:Dyp-type peroxidase [Corynebacterium anserum]
MSPQLSRRGFFAGLGMAGTAAVIASCSPDGKSKDKNGTTPDNQSAGHSSEDTRIDFDGEHQAGIKTAPQTHALVVAYDLKNRDSLDKGQRTADRLRRVMRIWTDDARSMTQGRVPLADLEAELTKAPMNLTITVGWGPQLLEKAELLDKVPAWVKNNVHGLPAFKGDKLNPEFSGGDIVLQICGDDLTAVSHAARVLTRGCRDFVVPRWTQRGFVDAPTGETPRNLLGFKDGTAIPRTDEEYDKAIWDELGGTAMVIRRIVFDIPAWEILDRDSREVVFGRSIVSGAPLGGQDEFDEVDLNKLDPTGIPFIDPHSHVGISAGEGKFMRRRAYNWDGEITPLGSSGLIFICFQNDPDKAFTPLQKRLAESDRLNQWITHVGSAVFWCPPGTQEGAYWGSGVLEG